MGKQKIESKSRWPFLCGHHVAFSETCRGLTTCNGDVFTETISLVRIVGVALQRRFRSLWFDANVIVHGSADPLLTAEITFGCLHGHVSKQKLDLVQFSSGRMAQLRA